MSTILEIKGLSKNFKKVQAVKQLDLKVEKEMIFGILGPNGSGKTTTLSMLLGVLHATQGTFSWFNNGEEDENRKRIGALLETPNFYPYLTARQNLEIVARIKGMGDAKDRIDYVLEKVDLLDRADSKFKTYSLGMKQRLAIGAVLLSDPEVLVLDEPTNGLDPQGIADIRGLIIEIGKSGKTIIIASHILDEIEKICTHCAILKKGELLQVGTINDIIGNQDVKLFKVNAEDKKSLIAVIQKLEHFSIYKDEDTQLIIRAPHDASASALNKLFFEQGVILSHLSLFQESLENQFLEIIRNS